ncbi:Phosphate-import permease protein PhnE [Fundidesulfovibrio magnetotacticus]|uniref:Phosphate-import permease protein PhnE n=1 Tax=Fundidesulfovibrio magnetotacticus TaxID=2730080 RepID=A0A6V8LIF4_9BACT|nr:phosphonate ABC transporter, permease protein PhnE [Fundidesulfovibrio magnetotacticus]GFK92522.1 Phosphate-import permease protein PhnE [Fundidesulfovibrio magnetotacticus]
MSAAALRTPFQPNWWARFGFLLLLVYCAYAVSELSITWERFVTGLHTGAKFLAELFPPSSKRLGLLFDNLVETVQIAVIASAVGIALSLPLGLLSARNLMPGWLTWPARAVIAISRSFHPVIFAILFVKAVGFGPLAGILTLVFASIGFVGKLFAEAIEEISLKPVEAVTAAGAPFMSVLTYAVLPQVFNRFIGFATYQFDSNLRNSTMIGVVGAGGIGGTLFAAFQRFDYDFLCTILLAIIGLIMVGEYLAVRIKATFND